MGDIERYIIEFLCYGDTKAAKRVQLSGPVDWTLRYPLLGEKAKGRDGEMAMWREGEMVVVSPELIYLVFFFISRAEELINTNRDEYGRFLAKHSTYSTNDWQIPMVDEYSRQLLKLLDLPLPTSGFAAVHLTHDIDTLTQYRHLRGTLGGIRRGKMNEVIAAWKDIHNDPAYTFPWMIEQDAECIKNAECRMQNAECIYFVKHTSGKGIDYPQYSLRGKDYRITSDMLLKSGAKMGIHSSAYATYPLPQGQVHRSHYLSCSIERMQQLVDAGITDDYTMGFADMAGFRLQTTRPVRWINPITLHLSPLTLHPLTVMDITLSSTNYMHLDEDEAYFLVAELMDRIRVHHGEINLLWHNTSFADGSYHKSLYPRIMQLL